MYKKNLFFSAITLSLLATQSAMGANCCLGRELIDKKWTLKETPECSNRVKNSDNEKLAVTQCEGKAPTDVQKKAWSFEKVNPQSKNNCYWTACPRATSDLSIEEKNKQAIRSKIREKMNATDTDNLKANSDIENQENSKTRPMLGQARKKAKELKKTNQQPVN